MKDYLLEKVYNEIDCFKDKELKAAKTEEEKQKIRNKYENIDIDELIKITSKHVVDGNIIKINQDLKNTIDERRKDDEEFLNRIKEENDLFFKKAEMLYYLIEDMARSYYKYVCELPEEKTKSKVYLFNSLITLHGRAMQMFLEIYTLAINGFADGAYARWRSLFEIDVVAAFILKNGEETAKAYCDEKYKNSNDWAYKSNDFKNYSGKISFKKILSKTDINSKEWNREYQLANNVVHSSNAATFGRLGNWESNPNRNQILIGRSNHGIDLPILQAANTLCHLTMLYFSIFANCDVIVMMNTIQEWLKEI